MKKIFTLSLAIFLASLFKVSAQCNAPVINSFSPTTGYIGSTITISGAYFDATASNNIVYFGATKATVLTASFGTLTVTAPIGATTAPISVTNNCKLTAYSAVSFNGIFCPTPITNSTYANTAFNLSGVNGAYNMLSQDMDLDGKPEIITGYGGVTVARNNSTPGNLNFTAYNFSAGSAYAAYVSTADFDGDGKRDIFTTHGFLRNTSTGPGNISFAVTGSGFSGYQSNVGDFNNDGKIDVVYENTGGTMYFYRNTSTGPGNISFTYSTQISVTHRSTGIQCADADGDGKTDVLSTQGNGNRMISIRNTTTPGASTFTFESIESWGTGGAYPYRCAIADFDKDGKIDLCTVNYNNGANNANTAILRNTSSVGDISFASANTYAGPQNNYRIAVGDVNGDGYPDIVTKSLAVQAFAVYPNTSSGAGNISFSSAYNYNAAAAEVSGIAIGDLDGDFVPDIATSGTSSGVILFHRNTSSQQDNTAPTASCKNITVALSPSGTATVTAAMIDNGSSDACGVKSILIDNAASKTFTCNDVGTNTVTLKVIDNSNNTTTCTATITVAPAAIIVSGQTTVCQGQTVTLNANQGDSYQWYNNSNAISGETSQTYVATASGNYQVEVTNSGGCSGTSSVTSITVNNNPTINVTPSGTTSLCNGKAVLTASTSSIYQWKLAGSDISGATQQTYTATATGTYSVKVIDVFGCSATSSNIVVTNDTENPVVTCPSDISVSNDAGICSAIVSITAATATDNCSVQSVIGVRSDAAALTANYPLGVTTITWTATDIYNNSSSCAQTVTVTDNENPVITCPSNISVSNDAGKCGATVSITDATAADNCGIKSIVGVRSDNLALNADYPVGTTTITWTATDNSNNTDVCNQTVTVNDTEKPKVTCPSNQTINLDANCSASLPDYRSLLSVSDNCSSTLTITQSPAPNTSINSTGNMSITFTVTDVSNNSSACSITLLKKDVTAPTITCPQNISVNNDANLCGAKVNFNLPSTSDNCNSSTGVHTLSYGEKFFDYANNNYETQYSPGLPLTFNPTDGTKMAVFLQSGSSTHYLYQDVTMPSSGSMQLGFDLQYNNHYSAFSSSQFVAVEIRKTSDNSLLQTLFKTVPGDPLSKSMTHYSYDLSAYAGQTIRLEMVDATINNYYFDVLLDNVTIPGSSLANGSFETGDYTNWNVYSSYGPYGTWGIGTAANVTLTQTAGQASGTTFPVGTTTNTFKATDLSGNSTTCSFTVTVTDNTNPVITCPSNITVSNDAGKCGATVSISDATAADNCGIKSIVGVRSDAAALTDDYPVGTTTITWTATDNSNNTDVCTQTVIVNDTENPKIACPSDFDIENDPSKCGASVSVGSATASDNCSIQSIVGVRSDAAALNADYPVGTTTITWTATDIHNNTASCTQTIKVSDIEAPVISTTAGSLDANLECSNSSGISSALAAKPSATDNCTSNPTLNLVTDNTYNTITTTGFTGSYAPSNWSLIKTSGSSGSVNTSSAPNSIQLYGSDGGGGGTKDTRYQVTVPTAGTITFSWSYNTTDRDGPRYDPFGYYLNGTFYQLSNNSGGNNQSGTNSVSVSVNDNFAFLIRSTDNILGASTTIASNFTAVTQLCANEYIRVRTWNFTDAASNVSSYFTQTIHVSDNTAPNVVTQTATVYLDGNGNGSIGVSDVNNGTTDNCGSMTYSVNKTNFNCSNIGSNTVTLTVKDACGNVGSNTANVIVIDAVKPVAICQNVTVTLSGGSGSITASQVDNGSNDACGIKSISVSPNTFNCTNIGANTVTLTVTDNNNNVSTCDATVTVVGTIPTVSISQGVQPVFCQGGAVVLSSTSNETVTYAWSNNATSANTNVYASGTYSLTVTNSYGCTNSTSTNVTYSQTDILSSYTILVTDEAEIEKESVVKTGGVGSTGAKGEVEVKDDSYITASGTFAKAKEVEIKSGSSVTNSYSGTPVSVTLPTFAYNPYCDTKCNSKYHHKCSSSCGNGEHSHCKSTCSSSSHKHCSNSKCNGKDDVKVKKGATVTITDSVFKKIHIESDATVIFTSKNIYADEIETQKGVTITFTGCTRIFLCKELKIHEGNTFNAANNSVIIYAEKKVDIKKGTTMNANVYTLEHFDTKADKKNRNTLTGMFIAEKVHAHYTDFNWNTVCGSCGSLGKKSLVADLDGLRDASVDYVNVYPNPTASITTVTVNANSEGTLKVEIISLAGKTLFSAEKSDFKGLDEIPLDLTTYAAGMYFIKVQYADTVKMFKVQRLN